MKRTALCLALCLSLSCIATRAASPTTPGNLDPAAAFQELKNGNQRYVSGSANSCAGATFARTKTATSQAPNAIVLSCSDSRVPPEQVFDQELGQLFVVRVAGNILNEDAIASMEYAIANLGARLILILGHESCGAIESAIKVPASSTAGSPNLDHLLAQIRKNLGKNKGAPDPKYRQAVMKNVAVVANELLKRSKIVESAVASGQVQIKQGIYDLSNGEVDFWESP